MSGHLDGVVFCVSFFGGRLGRCAKILRLVEEHIPLVRFADFAFGGKQLALELVQQLLEQVTLSPKNEIFTTQRFLFLNRFADLPRGLCQRLQQGRIFVSVGHRFHCLL